MLCLNKFLLLLFLLQCEDHIIFARQTLPGPVSRPSDIAVLNNTSVSSLIQAYSNSSVSASRSIINNQTHAIASSTAALPIPVYPNPNDAGDYKANKSNQDTISGTCAIKDLYCSSKMNNGTAGKVNATSTDDPCVLWDPSCSGNRTLARDTFFDVTFQHNLLENRCFVLAGSVNLANASACDKNNPPGRISEFQEMKNWMRSPKCASAAEEWAAIYESDFDPDSDIAVQMDPYQYHVATGAHPSCCGVCETNVDNVDIYYWPEPDLDTSCLSIIGDSIRPVDFGATKKTWSFGSSTTTFTYWGCETKPSTYYDTFISRSVTDTDPITTAEVRTIGSLSVKVYLSDPWSPSPCTESEVMSQGSNVSAQIRDRHVTMHARGHTLIIPSSANHIDNLPVTTMVSGNFTFTSPSIYANFHGITATDQCGGDIISSTMIAFAPGELSTLAGPLGDADGAGPSVLITKSFNFNDLPCPPQSVMEENWYKPQPGEPYRPLIALPNKLKEKIPWLSHCEDELFTAYDPPSTLKAGSALVAPILYSDTKAHSWAPVPSPTSNPGARQKAGAESSVPVPASVPILDQPKATVTAASAPPKQKGADPGPQPNDSAAQENSPPQPRPNTPATNTDPQGGNDPQQSSNSKQVSGNDGDSGPKEDPDLDNNINQVHDNHASNQNADPALQNDPEQTNRADPFDGNTGGQAKIVNNQVVQPLSYGISIAGTTLTPGASPIIVSGTLIHLGPSALVIGTSTVPLTPGDSDPITTTIAGHVITAAPDAIAVAGTTLTRGAPPITVSGTPIHFGSSALIVGTSTVPLAPEAPTQMTTTIGGQAITAASNVVAIAGNTLSPGAPGTTIDGTKLSLDPAGHFIVGSKTIPFPSKFPETITTNIAGQAITAAPNAVTVAGTTLSPGAPGITLAGKLISLNTASQLLIGSKTITLDSLPQSPIITKIGNQLITAAPNKIAIAGTALTPGASGATVDGTLVSLNAAGRLIVGPKTIALPSGSAGLGGLIMGGIDNGEPLEVPEPITTTIDGQVITAKASALIMAGTTLTPGAPGLTINGTVVSLNTAAQLVVGSKTVPLESERAGSSGQATTGLNGLVMGALGSGGPFGPFDTGSASPTQGGVSNGVGNGTGADVQVFRGSAARLKDWSSWSGRAVSVVMMAVLAFYVVE